MYGQDADFELNKNLECLWFVFSQFLQQELNTMSEKWNNHYTRASKCSQVSGIPEQLFKFSEIKGFEDQGSFVSPEDIDGIKNELDIHTESEIVLNVEDEDLKAYFTYIVEQTDLTYPPNDWQNALNMFSVIIEAYSS